MTDHSPDTHDGSRLEAGGPEPAATVDAGPRTDTRPFETPIDPGTGSGEIPELVTTEALEQTGASGDADTINVDASHEDTETGGV